MQDYLSIQFPIEAKPPLSEEQAIEGMNYGLARLIEEGAIKGPIDEVLKDFDCDLDSGYIIAHLTPDSLYDGSKLNTVGASSIYEVPEGYVKLGDGGESSKTFSAATIQERLRLSKLNPKVRMRYTVMDYKRYYKSKLESLKKHPEQLKALKNMFLVDLMGIMQEIVPYIEEGKQLNTLLGVSQVSPGMQKVARDLSIVYRRALKSDKAQGQIPKGIYSKLKEAYADFMGQLVVSVFPGIQETLSSQTEETPNPSQLNSKSKSTSRTYSYCDTDGRINLFESGS